MLVLRTVAAAAIVTATVTATNVTEASTITVTAFASAATTPLPLLSNVKLTGPDPLTLSSTTGGLGKLTTSVGTLYAFCIDLFFPIGAPTTYSVAPLAAAGDSTPGAAPVHYPLDVTQLKQINWLTLTATAEALSLTGLTGDRSVAYQVKIWEIAYGDDLSYDPLPASVQTELTSITSALSSADLSSVAIPLGLTAIDPVDRQGLVIGVPEPASLALLGAGLLGLGALARRRPTVH